MRLIGRALFAARGAADQAGRSYRPGAGRWLFGDVVECEI